MGNDEIQNQNQSSLSGLGHCLQKRRQNSIYSTQQSILYPSALILKKPNQQTQRD
jgi:hypothetical protein